MSGRARLGLVIAAAALIAVGAAAYAWPGGSGSAGDEEPPGGIHPPDDASLNAALAEAESLVGFPAKVPTFLPTSANRLVWVDSSRGPLGTGPGRIYLIYQSDTTVVVAGVEMPSVLDIFLTEGAQPNGERLALDAGPVVLYKDIVSVDEAGNPTKVTYMAVGSEDTIVMDFSGEQPTDEGVVQMLKSFKPLE